MRILNILFFIILTLFAFAQYNDPDGPLWMAIYAVPALWAGVAAYRPALLRYAALSTLLGLCLVAATAAMVYYWPAMPNWWQQQVWWEDETAREGMGVMIVLTALLVASLSGWLSRPRQTHSAP